MKITGSLSGCHGRYEDGKFLKKRNTFTDFVACSEYLIDKRYTSKEKLCIEGRSAGGLTMGAALTAAFWLTSPAWLPPPSCCRCARPRLPLALRIPG